MNEAVLSGLVSFMKLNLHADECADSAWLLRTATGECLSVFIDLKSAMAKEADVVGEATIPKEFSTYEHSSLPRNGEQASHFLAVVEIVKTRDLVGADSLLGALQRGKFLYVYINTANIPSYCVGDHILHIGKQDSERFLSFFRQYYVLHRVAINK